MYYRSDDSYTTARSSSSVMVCYCGMCVHPDECDALSRATICTDELLPRRQDQVVATRLDVETIDDLMFTTLNLTDAVFWMSLDYIIYTSLSTNANADVSVRANTQALLDSPCLYLPMIKEICEKWKIKLVWSFASFATEKWILDNVFNTVEFTEKFWKNFIDVIAKNSIEFIEFDLNTLIVLLLNSRNPEEILEQLPCFFWISVDNEAPTPPHNKVVRLFELLASKLHRVVLRSFAFFDIRELPTSKGRYRTMYLNCDNTLTSLKHLIETTTEFVDPSRIMMEMPTGGVEYAVKTTDKQVVEKYRYISNTTIRQRLRFAQSPHVEYYSAEHAASMIQFPQDNCWISYDNMEGRIAKIRYARDNGLGGIVVGPLQDDVSPESSDSLLKTVSQYL